MKLVNVSALIVGLVLSVTSFGSAANIKSVVRSTHNIGYHLNVALEENRGIPYRTLALCFLGSDMMFDGDPSRNAPYSYRLNELMNMISNTPELKSLEPEAFELYEVFAFLHSEVRSLPECQATLPQDRAGMYRMIEFYDNNPNYIPNFESIPVALSWLAQFEQLLRNHLESQGLIEVIAPIEYSDTNAGVNFLF